MQRAVAPRLDASRPGLRAAGLIPVALAAATAVAFLPVLGNGFVDWDDFHEPAGLARYFEEAARHAPEAPVPRLGLVRAWLTLGEVERARAEFEVLRWLRPDLAAVVAAAGGAS